MFVPTPHIEAQKGDFAQTVLMPGDPVRAKFIADNFLQNAKLVNQVRGMLGYTGFYKNCEVSVMASGMGLPSMCIYSYELFNFYDVKNIIRIGTAGAIEKSLKLKDIVIGAGTCTDLNYSSLLGFDGLFAPIASYDLVVSAVKSVQKLNLKYKVGNLISSSMFYAESTDILKKWQSFGILAVEMEAAGLYINAARAKKNAVCICSISDIPATHESLTSDQRQQNIGNIINVALDIAIGL